MSERTEIICDICERIIGSDIKRIHLDRVHNMMVDKDVCLICAGEIAVKWTSLNPKESYERATKA